MKELENDRTEAAITLLERRMEECRIQYELYFMGQEKREPKKLREDVQKMLGQVRNPKQTALKFRLSTLTNRWQTLTRYWDRVNLERENGTYRRDLERAKRHLALPSSPPSPSARDANSTNPDLGTLPQEAASHLLQPPASASSTISTSAAHAPNPAAAAPAGYPPAYRPPTQPSAPASPALTPSLHHNRLQEIYQNYVETRRQCQEGTEGISYQAIVRTIEKQIPRFQEKGYTDVDFQVIVKDGKAALKPVVKK